MRVAWFSPVPPVRSGIAGRSAELIEALRQRGLSIDVYVDEPVARIARDVSSAHDFVWRHCQQAYDLSVFQFGNSSHHDYAWPYALKYPGLVVMHDTHLHHARAALLLREKRVAEYRAEFAWNHPHVNPDLAEIAIAGLDSALYYQWPMVRTLIESARLVAVHGEGARAELLESLPESADRIVSIRLGEGEVLSEQQERDSRQRVRAAHGIPGDAIVFGVVGGLTPEKRIPQALAALAAVLPHAPNARLLLAGAPASHYDVRADIAARGLDDRVIVTGYLASDAEITAHLAACDVTLNLRWPTARETSGPWLRALAAGRATVITDLVHVTGLASLDPRTWTVNHAEAPVCVAIDILDEDHSLRLAMRRLAADAALRAALGQAAREWWAREHSVDVMVDDYVRAMTQAIELPPPRAELPAHARDSGDQLLHRLLEPFGPDVTARIQVP